MGFIVGRTRVRESRRQRFSRGVIESKRQRVTTWRQRDIKGVIELESERESYNQRVSLYSQRE